MQNMSNATSERLLHPGTAVQLGLDGTCEIQYTDKLKAGSPASEVFCEILRLYPGIRRVSYTLFDPNDPSSEVASLQGGRWLASSLVDRRNLKYLSELFFEGGKKVVETSNTEAIILRQALAIGSKVSLLAGGFAHIPMMDFVADPEFDEDDVLKEIKSHRGVLLESGFSFHFWGFNLMREEEWRQFLFRCLESNREGYFDRNFIESSLERGFSALRIFGYPDTEKEYEPRIVAFT